MLRRRIVPVTSCGDGEHVTSLVLVPSLVGRDLKFLIIAAGGFGAGGARGSSWRWPEHSAGYAFMTTKEAR